MRKLFTAKPFNCQNETASARARVMRMIFLQATICMNFVACQTTAVEQTKFFQGVKVESCDTPPNALLLSAANDVSADLATRAAEKKFESDFQLPYGASFLLGPQILRLCGTQNSFTAYFGASKETFDKKIVSLQIIEKKPSSDFESLRESLRPSLLKKYSQDLLTVVEKFQLRMSPNITVGTQEDAKAQSIFVKMENEFCPEIISEFVPYLRLSKSAEDANMVLDLKLMTVEIPQSSGQIFYSNARIVATIENKAESILFQKIWEAKGAGNSHDQSTSNATKKTCQIVQQKLLNSIAWE